MSSQITKRLICLWKGCDELVFEEAADFKAHVDKHIQEQMQSDLDNRGKDGTEEQQEVEPLAKKAKLNADNKLSNGVDIGRRKVVFPAVEVWTDIFGFVKRIQLARISLTNRHIHQICWPRLHGSKVEPYKIREMVTIIGQERFDQGRPPKALVLKSNDKAMPMPSCPLPSYISGFDDGIRIKFLDQQVVAFFTHILPCLAKTGFKISLNFNESDAEQCALLDQLLNKFKDGLPTNKLYAYCLPTPDIQYLPDIDNKLPIINPYLRMASDIPILMKMLASPRSDCQQRVIHLPSPIGVPLVLMLIRTIKEDLHSSTQRLLQPFYICFNQRGLDVPRSAETNEQTDEQLTIMSRRMPAAEDDTNNRWEICRHPRGQHEQWAEDCRKRVQLASSIEDFTTIHVDLSRDNA